MTSELFSPLSLRSGQYGEIAPGHGRGVERYVGRALGGGEHEPAALSQQLDRDGDDVRGRADGVDDDIGGLRAERTPQARGELVGGDGADPPAAAPQVGVEAQQVRTGGACRTRAAGEVPARLDGRSARDAMRRAAVRSRVVVGATREDDAGSGHRVIAPVWRRCLDEALAVASGLSSAKHVETRIGFRARWAPT